MTDPVKPDGEVTVCLGASGYGFEAVMWVGPEPTVHPTGSLGATLDEGDVEKARASLNKCFSYDKDFVLRDVVEILKEWKDARDGRLS